MAARELELRELYLEVKRGSAGAKFPVLHADLSYGVDAFPSVKVTISSAAAFNGGNRLGDISSLFQDSPEGSEATLWLTISSPRKSNKSIALFCGYISGTGSNLMASIASVQSNITFQLVCKAAAMNANPAGAFTYFSVGGGGNKYLPKPYLQQLNGNAARLGKTKAGDKKPIQSIIAETFVTNPAKSIITLIDELRGMGNDRLSKVAVADGFSTDNITFKLKINTGLIKSVVQRFGAILTNALVGSPAASVTMSTLKSLFLSVVPQTVSDGKPCKMIVRPVVTGWNPKPKVALEAGDVLGVSDSVAYRLDQRVDFWYVQVGNGEIEKSQPLAAVYAPGYGKNGEAVFLNILEFKTEIDKTGKSNAALVGRGTVLPWWMFNAVKRTSPIPPAKKEDGKKIENTPVNTKGTSLAQKVDKEDSRKLWEDACKRVAVSSFLENGCAVNNVSLRVPLYTMLQLMPWLGDTISFEVPSPQQTVSENELYKITTTPRYGLLKSISITIDCNAKEIQVHCNATLSQVHDKALHEQLSAENPIYMETPGNCYNAGALNISNEVL